MPAITTSLSEYVAPDYVVDKFPTYRNGKRSVSYITASVYNKLASSIVASQSRCKVILPTLGLSVPIEIKLWLTDGSTDIPYSKNDGSADYPWVEGMPGEGEQNGISDAIISASTLAGSGQVAIEYFYGKKTMSTAAANRMAYRWYERRPDASQGEGSCIVGNWHNGAAWEQAHTYTPTIDRVTWQDVSLVSSGRPLRLHANALIPTPYRARPNWTSHETQDKTTPNRIIIGACRASSLGTQYRRNREVFNPPLGVTGHVSVPSPHTSDGKTLLGPGALMMTGTFWVITDTDTAVTSRRQRFHCYPGGNAPVRHVLPNRGEFYAQVLVLGKKA